MADLKILTTQELLELRDACETDCVPRQVPWETVARLDAQGRHILQAHSLFNNDPGSDVVHARTMLKLYDEGVEQAVPTVMDIRRERWDDIPDYYVEP